MDWQPELTLVKDPDSTLDYAFDWDPADDPWLSAGDSIDSYSISADAGITVDSDAESGNVVTVFLSGGTGGMTYTVTCQVTTTNGLVAERSIKLHILEQ